MLRSLARIARNGGRLAALAPQVPSVEGAKNRDKGKSTLIKMESSFSTPGVRDWPTRKLSYGRGWWISRESQTLCVFLYLLLARRSAFSER